jgi:hypothetical protein
MNPFGRSHDDRCRILPTIDVSNCDFLAGEKRNGELCKAYINRNEHIQPVVLGPRLRVLIVLFCRVMADYKRVFRKLLEEAFRRCAIDVKVQTLHWDEQSAQR